jgi:hypothetical protein
VTRPQFHRDGCECDQVWHHRPPRAVRKQARQDTRAALESLRHKGKAIGHAQKLARGRRQGGGQR